MVFAGKKWAYSFSLMGPGFILRGVSTKANRTRPQKDFEAKQLRMCLFKTGIEVLRQKPTPSSFIEQAAPCDHKPRAVNCANAVRLQVGELVIFLNGNMNAHVLFSAA